MRKVPATRVGRRHVLFVAGYDPMAVEGHHRIFLRELKRFGAVWRAATACRDAAPVPTPTGALWRCEAQGPGWHTNTAFEILAWDDLARADMQRPASSHLRGSLRAVLDMVTSGTIAAYFRSSRRYGFFFLFTYLLLLAFWGAAVAVGFGVAHLLAPHLGAVAAGLGGAAAALAGGLLLMRWPGRRFRLRQSLDLAEFSVDFAHGRHPEVDARVMAFAGRLRAVEAEAAREGVEEIIIAGHSLGAMHAVSTVAAALDQDPAFGTRVPVRILTLGSTTAKFALHPAGARLRAAAQRVAGAPQVGWVEVQSRDDIVSFYKVNPVTLDRATFAEPQLAVGDFSQRPLLRHVPVRDMVSRPTYRRFFLDVMRRHCQCFLASDIRAPHDFYAYVCGPFAFDVLAAHMDALCAYMAPDGTPLPASLDPGGRLMPHPDQASPE
ncbi:hypothetical protein K9U40_06530 [Xanthobacter autotrophicus]|uniref:hypothetical protein n=1 Tax=Xanthobacter TaxID=279 RepID=UPI0024AC5629|nr:hypothetical protein [Xanthobacter autotrophicus]MDI4663984.1 hypothetical protein [Xanthobacter autotrophicus]